MFERLKDESFRKRLVNAGIILSIAAMFASMAIALFGQPITPSVLEVTRQQSELQCTQHSQSATDEETQATGAVGEVYEWTCEADEPTQYVENRAKDKARSSTDADLLAQERVAHWTHWLGIFTGFGLVALVGTLMETRKVSAITRDIGERQVRAYLSIPEAGIKINSLGIVVEGKIRNSGQSPARRVDVKFDLSWYKDGFGNDTSFVTRIGDVVAGEDGKPFYAALSWLHPEKGEPIPVPDDIRISSVRVACVALDVFDQKIDAEQRFKFEEVTALDWDTLIKLPVSLGMQVVPVAGFSEYQRRKNKKT